jgi:hypothetical protein
VAVSNVSRPSSAKEGLAEPGALIVAVGLIFEVGCAKERGPLVNQRILRLKIYHCSVRRQQD